LSAGAFFIFAAGRNLPHGADSEFTFTTAAHASFATSILLSKSKGFRAVMQPRSRSMIFAYAHSSVAAIAAGAQRFWHAIFWAAGLRLQAADLHRRFRRAMFRPSPITGHETEHRDVRWQRWPTSNTIPVFIRTASIEHRTRCRGTVARAPILAANLLSETKIVHPGGRLHAATLGAGMRAVSIPITRIRRRRLHPATIVSISWSAFGFGHPSA